RLARHLAMTCACANKLGPYCVEFKSHTCHALAQNAIGGFGFFVSVGPRVDQRSNGFIPCCITDRNFIGVGRGPSFDSAEAHSIKPLLLKMNAVEVGDAVGRDVASWIAYFVEKLFGHAGNGHTASSARMSGNNKCAVGFGFNNWITAAGILRHLLP